MSPNISKPGWWFNTVNMRETFKTTTATTKHGEHTRYYVAGKGRVNEATYNNLYKGALYQNQVRGYARETGIKNWNEAQSKFAQVRSQYMAEKKALEKGVGKPMTEREKEQRQAELEELWEKIAYDQVFG